MDLPPIPTGPTVALFLSPEAAVLVAAIIGEHTAGADRIARKLREYAGSIDPTAKGGNGQWWIFTTPLSAELLESLKETP